MEASCRRHPPHSGIVCRAARRRRHQPRHQPLPRTPRAGGLLAHNTAAAVPVPASELGYWDVVEYSSGGDAAAEQLRLGLVQEVLPDHIQLSPLVEEHENVWVPEADDAEVPEQQQRVPLGCVLRVVDAAYGQRQDKEHNPHGEHAHDVWQVLVPLSPGVFRGGGSSSSGGGSSLSNNQATDCVTLMTNAGVDKR